MTNKSRVTEITLDHFITELEKAEEPIKLVYIAVDTTPAWDYLLSRPVPQGLLRVGDREFTMESGASLTLVNLDDVEKLRGLSLAGVLIDEDGVSYGGVPETEHNKPIGAG